MIPRLAVDFFSSRKVPWVVVLMCEFSEHVRVFRQLVTEGSFQVVAPAPGLQHQDFARLLLGYSHIGILVSIGCYSADKQKWISSSLNASYHWLVEGEVEAVEAWPLRLDTDLTVVTKANNLFRLAEVHRRQPGERSRINRAVSWSPAEGLADSWDRRLTARRTAVDGMAVKTVQFVNVNMTEERLKGLAGLSVDNTTAYLSRMANCNHIIFLGVASKYNLTVKFMSVTDPGQLNSRPGDEFLYGEVGLLDRSEVDVCTTGLYMTPARTYSMEHTYPTWELRFGCVFLTADALGSSDALFKPFAWSAWVGMFCITLLTLLLHKLFSAISGPERSWSASVLSAVGTLTSQGFFTATEWLSFRMLLLSFQVFCLLTNLTYSASIVKYLLRPPANTINSLQDLLRAPYDGVADNWLPTQRDIKLSNDPLVHDALERILPPRGLGFVTSAEGQVAVALKSRAFAFYADDNTLYDAVRRFPNSELCQLQELDLHPSGLVGVSMTKNLSIKEHFRVGILLSLESGLSYRETNTWHDRRPPCLQGAGSEASSPVGTRPVLPAISLLVMGVLTSAAIFYVERNYKNSILDM